LGGTATQNGDAVYQLNIQLFALTKPIGVARESRTGTEKAA
jgi:hypothetical protein